jgi:hypothetical protein
MTKIESNPKRNIDEIRKRLPELIIYQRFGQYYIRKKSQKKDIEETDDIPDCMDPTVTSDKSGIKK